MIVAFVKIRNRHDYPFDTKLDGLFVQLESATIDAGNEKFSSQKVVWFVPLIPDAERGFVLSVDKKVALDPDNYSLMPKLLR